MAAAPPQPGFEAVLLRWLGTHNEINSLQELSDGRILCKLVESLSNSKLPFNIERPTESNNETVRSLTRINKLLLHTRSKLNIKAPIAPEDLLEWKNFDLISEFLWNLIAHFQKIDRFVLLVWVRNILSTNKEVELPVDFGDSWKSGVTMAVLIKYLVGPSLELPALNNLHAADLFRLINTIALKKFNIPTLITVDDYTKNKLNNERLTMLFLSYFTNLDLQGTITVRDEEAITKLEEEKKQLETLLVEKEKIVLEAQQQNEMITNKYSQEIAYLLKNQKETQMQIQEMNKRANGYSKKIVELQIAIKDQTPQTHTSLQAELQSYEILNEELNRKADALEAQLRDANQKAAQLFNWLKDVTAQDPDLNTKLDDAIAEVHRLVAIKIDLEEQIAELKRQNNDLTVYMHWLHSQLKKTSLTTQRVVKKIVSPREVEPLVDVLKLAEGLIDDNVNMLETMTNEFKQVKLDTVEKLQALLQS
jgi:uncharacterized coiled-coil DUF342 family protein